MTRLSAVIQPAAGCFFAMLLGACGTAPDPGGGPISVELGTGSTEFQALGEGDDLGLITGPQGGHHFIVNARARDLEPGDPFDPSASGNPHTVFLAFDAAGDRIDLGIADYTLGYVAEDDYYVLPSGRLLLMSEDALPAYGDLLSIRVELSDASGEAAAQELTIHVVDGGLGPGPDGGFDDGDAGLPDRPDAAGLDGAITDGAAR
jgi:hypothetical protein